MMSHMFVEVDDNVHAQDDVILYNNDIRIDEYTFKGVGANSEQLSAMNHDSLKRSTFQMTVKYNQNGELTMDGISLKRLRKASVHLPLFMMNYKLENKCVVIITHLKESGLKYNISYASKAFTCLQMVKLVAEEDLQLDVVSEGELYTALEAGFEPSRIHFHGNNKTKHEIRYALENKIGYFVIDSLEEIDLIDRYANDTVQVVIRVNPGLKHIHMNLYKLDKKIVSLDYQFNMA